MSTLTLGAQLRAQHATLLAKTYATMGAGLALTGITAMACLSAKLSGPGLVGLVVGLFALLFAVMFTRGATSAILFLAFSVVEGILVGPYIAHYGLAGAGSAAALTALMFGGLTGYVMVTGKDFSAWGAGLFVALLVLIGASIMSIFLPVMNVAVCAAAVILFSVYVLYDTSEILHGKYGENEYGRAALGLYLDVVNIFVHLLPLLGKSDD